MRILLLGISPLPWERSRHHGAPGLRTWQLCQALLDDDHRVCLVTFGEESAGEPPPGSRWLRRVRLGPADVLDPGRLERALRDHEPDAAVAASSYHCTRAAATLGQLAPDLPLWIDLPGDLMAEAQVRAALARPGEEVDFVADYRAVLLPALRRGDRFSAVSARQSRALLGQLGLAGRLGAGTLGEELVAVMPVSAEAPDAGAGIRPPGLPDGGRFVVCSSGSFNSWMDVDTLFEGLERAMTRDSRVCFVAAGGDVPGHCEAPLDRLRRRVDASSQRDRFHLLGWLEPAELRGLYGRADVAANLDLPCLEAELGSRNRVLDWARHGLACVTTPGTELCAELADREAALAVPFSDPEALARLLCELAGARRPELEPLGQRARRLVLQRYAPARTTAALRRWARAPRLAGDAPQRGTPPAADSRDALAEALRLRQQLDAVQGSAAYGVLRRAERLAREVRGTILGKKTG